MLHHFVKNLDSFLSDNKKLLQEVRAITPSILSLPSEEQLFYWELIGSKISSNQEIIITDGISDLLTTDQQKDTYAQGITFLSFDIAQFNESVNTLKNIKNPDKDLLGAIASMEELQRELEKRNKKPKM